jgi:cytochrome c oxidase subunit I+III
VRELADSDQKTVYGAVVEADNEKFTYWPLFLALGFSLFIFGLVLYIPLMLIGLAVLAISLGGWLKDNLQDRFSTPQDFKGEVWPMIGVTKEKMGTWTFLASEAVLFGAIISSYIYIRVETPNWPPSYQIHDVTIGAINTIVLLTSSLTMIFAREYAHEQSIRGLKASLILTFLLGTTFLAVKGYEWAGLIAGGFLISSSLPAATYYITTGAHAVHVGAGLVAVSFLMIKAFQGKFTSENHYAIEHVGLYWHFVDIVWMFLFPLFYLI